MAMDVLVGAGQPATFKELCRDLRYCELAIRAIVDRLEEAHWVILERDKCLRRPISRLRISLEKNAVLEDGLAQLHIARLGS